MKPETKLAIDPNLIKASTAAQISPTPKAAFADVMGGVSAMGPASAELMAQWTGGSDMAGAVLNAAFSGVNVSGQLAAPAGYGGGGYGSSMPMSMGGYGGYGAYSSSPGVMGSPRYTTQTGFAGQRYGANDTLGMGAGDFDPAAQSGALLESMNTNNLKLLELQAMMQSNMQQWTTKSNILSADHRARMSMVEKFSARG